MNPQRLAAALAALAVGFGVTLVGVQLVDDGDAVATVTSAEADVTIPDEGVDVDDEAQQDETPAEPPPEAEVVEGGEAPRATSSGQTPPRDGGNGGDPNDDPACEAVLVVRTGSGELLILSGALGEFTESGGSFSLPGSDESIEDRFRAQDVVLISGVIDDRFERRSVEDCRTGETAEATVLVDFGESRPEATTPVEVDEAAPQDSTQRFPCSDAAFEVLLDELDVLEETELISDASVFVRVLAKRLARLDGNSVAEWEADIELEFDEFVSTADCFDEIDEVFIDAGGDEFFCAAANVSADPRLFAFLDEVVPDEMAQCSSAQEEGVN